MHKGELLAVLENRDLAAAAQENKGSHDQARPRIKPRLRPTCRKKSRRPTGCAGGQGNLDAQQKLYDSRQELYQQGAMPRKELDQSRVEIPGPQPIRDCEETPRSVSHRQAAGIQVGRGQLNRRKANIWAPKRNSDIRRFAARSMEWLQIGRCIPEKWLRWDTAADGDGYFAVIAVRTFRSRRRPSESWR